MRLRLSGASVFQLCQMPAAIASRRWATRVNTPWGGAGAVGFEAELALEGVVDRLDPLPDSAEVAVAGVLVAAVRAQHPHAECGDLGFDVAPGQALVGQHRGARAQQAGLHGDGQQVQAHVAFAELGIGQAPGDGHPVRRGEQVELQAPVVAGVGGAEPVAADPSDVAALDRLAGGPAGQRGGVDEPQVITP